MAEDGEVEARQASFQSDCVFVFFFIIVKYLLGLIANYCFMLNFVPWMTRPG